MSKHNSDGEVYGSKALTFAIIATSALILAGTIYSPAPQTQQTGAAQPTVEQVVVTAHPAATKAVAG
jgi:hypothetical protein